MDLPKIALAVTGRMIDRIALAITGQRYCRQCGHQFLANERCVTCIKGVPLAKILPSWGWAAIIGAIVAFFIGVMLACVTGVNPAIIIFLMGIAYCITWSMAYLLIRYDGLRQYLRTNLHLHLVNSIRCASDRIKNLLKK